MDITTIIETAINALLFVGIIYFAIFRRGEKSKGSEDRIAALEGFEIETKKSIIDLYLRCEVIQTTVATSLASLLAKLNDITIANEGRISRLEGKANSEDKK